ncbi:M20 family metallopeptidase [Ilumatobacter sp.]|uniref:M20 family metallopeptidase n=1 Tax=Ilumatobacter sp. TaxID=1967498 RepID=UPI003C5F2F28
MEQPESNEHDHVAQRTLELVAAPSETGSEHPAIDLIASWLGPVADEVDAWVTPMADLETDPAYPGREVERDEVPVVAARIVGARPGPTVVLTGHADVVPVGDRAKWTRDPAGELDGDVLYGRGSADMKGGVVAAVEAFTRIANGDRDFAGELCFVAVPGEEDGGTGTLAAIRRGWTGDCVIVPEPTSGADGPQVVVAHGGALTYTIEVDGRSAHAATRLLGESALDHFLTVYAAVGELEREVNEAEQNPAMTATGLPYPTTVGVVNGGVWASNVMEQISAELRVGVTIDESIQEAEQRFERTLRAAIAGDPWLDAHPPRIERTGAAFGSSSIDPGHVLVSALRDAAESESGVRPGTIGVPYGCDMALWRREAGAACAVYGPGDIAHAHAVDEQVSIAEVVLTSRILEATVLRLLA